MKKELIPVVNINDKIIGYKERTKIVHEDIYRISSIWIINSKDEILLGKRAATKRNNPLMWSPAVNGTVEKSESYHKNAIKELYEELHIKSDKLIKGPKIFIDKKHRAFCQLFILNANLNIKTMWFDKNEIEILKWFKKEDIISILKKDKTYFVPSMPQIIKEFL